MGRKFTVRLQLFLLFCLSANSVLAQTAIDSTATQSTSSSLTTFEIKLVFSFIVIVILLLMGKISSGCRAEVLVKNDILHIRKTLKAKILDFSRYMVAGCIPFWFFLLPLSDTWESVPSIAWYFIWVWMAGAFFLAASSLTPQSIEIDNTLCQIRVRSKVKAYYMEVESVNHVFSVVTSGEGTRKEQHVELTLTSGNTISLIPDLSETLAAQISHEIAEFAGFHHEDIVNDNRQDFVDQLMHSAKPWVKSIATKLSKKRT